MRENARRTEREKTESDRCASAHVELVSLKHHRGWKSKAEAEEDDDDDDDDDGDDEDDGEDEEDNRPASLSRLNRPTLALHPSCTHTKCMWWGKDYTGVESVFRRYKSFFLSLYTRGCLQICYFCINERKRKLQGRNNQVSLKYLDECTEDTRRLYSRNWTDNEIFRISFSRRYC